MYSTTSVCSKEEHIMRKLGVFVVVLSLCLSVIAGNVSWAQTYTIKFAGNMPVGNANSKAMVVFKDELEKLTNGEVQVDLFPAMQLGGAGENVDMVNSGTLFMCYVGAAYVVGYVPELGVLSLPFLFKDRPTAHKIVTGELGRELLDEMDSAGFVGLAFWDLGSRNITNNERPITQPADLEGIKIRLQPSKVMLATFRALGANPVSMDIKEVYSALKQGVIDAQENPFAFIRDHRFYEVQEYLSVTGHFYDVMAVFANKERFNALPEDIQASIWEAMATATEYQWEQAGKDDQAAFDELVEKGMTVNRLTLEQVKLFQEKTQSVYDEESESIGQEWIDKFVEANK
ncbi:DctP family TRAP transporter solute-binding subunit [candidate division KSB3 bacterium]|uniref:DctP family TRAP transporter solute-binding subunit n=1 Tax=candidate division KSB3 bacterium TaxID=2044937 RepID=A0A9D5Q460_9BACT|nr:DctP family TRAP transporter solute-binding subunit [candidate division KSB3 bacterium]MBD3323220.1 DctP family TRAP transporter solute-binding subunit [candidate division KSB3 bacterium]